MLGTLEALFSWQWYVLGYQDKSIHLGTSGVLLAALYFGHLGYQSVYRSRLGLALFVGAVGLTAGPRFFRNLKQMPCHTVLLPWLL